MTRTGLAALLLVAAPLVAGCGSDPTCDDVDVLEQQLADTDVDDPAYNDIVNDLQQAEADCSS
jgi:hypothetical protein